MIGEITLSQLFCLRIIIKVLLCIFHPVERDCSCCVWFLVMFSYAEYMLVKDVSNVIKVPDSLPLDVAAILPCGALAAYAAVQRVRPFIEDRLRNLFG